MRFFNHAQVEKLLPYPVLIAGLKDAFAAGEFIAPLRPTYGIGGIEQSENRLLLMPAWDGTRFVGVKVVTFFPRNDAADPTINAVYLLMSAENGQPLAVVDGEALTTRRTAATSVLASSLLARADARRLLVVGGGRVAMQLIAAYAAGSQVDRIAVWTRREDRSLGLRACFPQLDIEVVPPSGLAQAVARADIVSCATSSVVPVIKHEWLRSGQHLDLIGSFTPAMCETDVATLARGKLFVDSAAAISEAGEIVRAIECGAITAQDIAGDLAALCRGLPARTSPDDLTIFKSVGTAMQDLVASIQIYQAGAAVPGDTASAAGFDPDTDEILAAR